jgi:hypothetical protein
VGLGVSSVVLVAVPNSPLLMAGSALHCMCCSCFCDCRLCTVRICSHTTALSPRWLLACLVAVRWLPSEGPSLF